MNQRITSRVELPAEPFEPTVLEAAYQAVLPEIEAIDAKELKPINLDVMTAVTRALGVAHDLGGGRSRLVEGLPEVDEKRLDKLADYALAAAYAHTQHLVATRPADVLPELHEEAAELRLVLRSDALALGERKLLPQEALRELRGPVGYRHVATDLQMLVNLLKAHWPSIKGKCATTEVELNRGAVLVTQIMHTVGARGQGAVTLLETADLRLRAFTLLVRAYEEVRRAVIYLRWHYGDADDLVPSLYAGRRRRRGKGEAGAPRERGARREGQAPSALVLEEVGV